MRILVICSCATFYLLYLNLHFVYGQDAQQELAAKRTRAIALVFAYIQCFPDETNIDPASQNLINTNKNFNPEDHKSEYANRTEIENLIALVKSISAAGTPENLPFVYDPVSVKTLQTILIVLYRNTGNWNLFYNTTVWLLRRVNSSMLCWALMIVCAEKYPDTVTVPSMGEIFPQYFIQRDWVLSAAGLKSNKTWYVSPNPLYYWMSDPGLNEFHTHHHMDMPVWWDDKVYGVMRYRKGEQFLYTHRQILLRYNAERLSNFLPDASPIGLDPEYPIPEGYWPDVLNINYHEFPIRPEGYYLGDFDGPDMNIWDLKLIYDRIWHAIDLGYFEDKNGDRVYLKYENNTDILGATVEASNVYSANYDYYGNFHNLMHRYLAWMYVANPPIPGVTSHHETTLQDRVTYQFHKNVDNLYLKLKDQLSPPYEKKDLEFPGVTIMDLNILTCPWENKEGPTFGLNLTWPFSLQQPGTPTLYTYMDTEIFDISNAARPCRSINDNPVNAPAEILNHLPFTYVIPIKSRLTKVAYGMMRIFMWPQYTLNGYYLQGDDAHMRAIELDRFRVKLAPNDVTVIVRSSTESTLARREPSPGIKELYAVEAGDELLTDPKLKRACGFPINLLIPRGTKDGMPFRLTAYISDETADGDMDDSLYPQYPLCGVLNGKKYPDKRAMGFPFDRPGTNFTIAKDKTCGFTQLTISNVKQINVNIKHYESKKKIE